ncbi:hypothetical protein [Sphingobium sp. CCH11-B1]|jgi:hypothetical protein|uniref:hypothetical protein n=1 Tax=Sphingobium sp. CCH11-B1 TaxID=1768781 RepID=UPI0008324030|nr:hypothetical protein [Sphingobium sp. CCH11-B1]MEA3388296.1 hypothetical protein [Pseudomonadota bacterium]
MIRPSIPLLLGLALGGLAAPAIALAPSRPDPYVAKGKPVDCIQLSAIRTTQVRDDRTIDFIMNGNKVYRNILPNSCPTLGFEKRFSYRTSLSQLCSVDIITVLYNVGSSLQPGASCGLGQFQPMARAGK